MVGGQCVIGMGEQCLFEGCLCEIGRGVTRWMPEELGIDNGKKERQPTRTINNQHPTPDNQKPTATIDSDTQQYTVRQSIADNRQKIQPSVKNNPEEEIASKQRLLKKGHLRERGQGA
jgi:hypothetical protein